MSNVIPIDRITPQDTDQRRLFLEAVAMSFDRYVADHGEEPDSVVYVIGGIKQKLSTGWTMQGESRNGARSMLAMATVALMRDASA